MESYSPAIQQYLNLKAQNKNSILFFRMGDFYEMYFDDAILASEELDISLTKRNCGKGKKAPSCGVPYHSCEAYIQRLVDKGYRVAICEQTDRPAENGIQEREIVRIVTRGTVMSGEMLREGENNFLCAVNYAENSCGVCFVDITTGKLYLTQLDGEDIEKRLIEETGKMSPSEIIINREGLCLERFIGIVNTLFRVNAFVCEDCSTQSMNEIISASFAQPEISKCGLEEKQSAAKALGNALIYIKKSYHDALSMIREIDFYDRYQFLEIDGISQRNLEITENRSKAQATLLNTLDCTKTAMGKRLLKQMLLKPLSSKGMINSRLDAVDCFYGDEKKRQSIRKMLSGVCDMERTASKILCSKPEARDFIKLRNTLAILPGIVELLGSCNSSLLRDCAGGTDILKELHDTIENSIDEAPDDDSIAIKCGYSEAVDKCREIIREQRDIINQIKKAEEARGIKGLKIKLSKTLGYYIEIPSANPDNLPSHYICRQMLTNCSRYTIKELQDAQFAIERAIEQSEQIQRRIFEEIREQTGQRLMQLQKSSSCIAMIDVMSALADDAKRLGYVKPKISARDVLFIKEGRHPVVEQFNTGEKYIANDVLMDSDDNRTLIITGPNMAGKSTYMRQTALIVLMAHIGSFVPAKQAEIPVIDKIFTRIGSSDSLSDSRSTFMTEMEECVNIVNNATARSLIIFDEIGRGTSTYDGMAIARSILEYCNDKGRLGAKTMFATHYHELCSLEKELDGVKNYNVEVDDNGDELSFTRHVARGSAKSSYGIRAAKMVGMREDIVNRANEILHQMQEK